MKEQIKKLITGNEAVAEAAKAINFHFMGFYPITPSTEIAQHIDAMKARGEVDTVLLAADGEHGAAGACYGASSGGARVLNATSANGFLYSLEQLPVQAGTRLPMVLNLVTRSVSGPLDIRCDHSDLVYALQTGWIILLASTPQAVYDMNILAVKLGEHPVVRLPVMVVSDGFFTSHQRQSVEVFKDRDAVQNFIGPRKDPFTTLDPRKPITLGPYMNDPDLINNKFQLHEAHQKALEVYKDITAEYFQLTGRNYPSLETYGPEEATGAVVLLNSAAETFKDAIDAAIDPSTASPSASAKPQQVTLIKPNILRPFPSADFLAQTKELQCLLVGERSDSPGTSAGPLGQELADLMIQHTPAPRLLHRVYGLGGKDFKESDALSLIQEVSATLSGSASGSISGATSPRFGFIGSFAGEKQKLPPQILPALTPAEMKTGLVAVEKTALGVEVKLADVAQFALKPKRIVPGHGACPGCGIFSALDQFFKGLEGDIVVLYHTGCAMVVTTDYPFSAHRVTYLHNLFQNGAPTLSGLVEAFFERQRRGEIEASQEITFVMVTGDGGMDIGMGPSIGTALRGHKMILLEYDNQGYMNTGGQLSYTTPKGHKTSTSHTGVNSFGKHFHHKDTPAIMAATGIPYVFTAIESLNTDLIAKASKAQWYAKNHGFVYGKLLTSCPLNWQSEEKQGQSVLQAAVDSCFFPLYEIEMGKTQVNYDPEKLGKKIPLKSWLALMGKTRHLIHDSQAQVLEDLQKEIDRRWKRLQALAEHPLL